MEAMIWQPCAAACERGTADFTLVVEASFWRSENWLPLNRFGRIQIGGGGGERERERKRERERGGEGTKQSRSWKE
jgi:hypothetical protein